MPAKRNDSDHIHGPDNTNDMNGSMGHSTF